MPDIDVYAVRDPWSPTSGAVELPGNPIRVFEGDVAFPQCLVQLDPRVLNPGRLESLRYPVELAFVCTSKGDVIETDSRRVEAVAWWCISCWTSDSEGSPTGCKEEEVRTIKQHGKPKGFRVESPGSRDIAHPQGYMVHSRRLGFDAHWIFFS
jgi:hypothetical protein